MLKFIVYVLIAIALYLAIPWQMKQIEKSVGGDSFLRIGRWYLTFMIAMIPICSFFGD